MASNDIIIEQFFVLHLLILKCHNTMFFDDVQQAPVEETTEQPTEEAQPAQAETPAAE